MFRFAPAGEDPGAPIAALIGECTAAIPRVAEDLEVELLPLHDRLAALLAEKSRPSHHKYVPGMRSTMLMVSAGALHYLLGMSWDQIAARRGLTLTIDLVHLNDRAGVVVADLVEGFATQTSP